MLSWSNYSVGEGCPRSRRSYRLTGQDGHVSGHGGL